MELFWSQLETRTTQRADEFIKCIMGCRGRKVTDSKEEMFLFGVKTAPHRSRMLCFRGEQQYTVMSVYCCERTHKCCITSIVCLFCSLLLYMCNLHMMTHSVLCLQEHLIVLLHLCLSHTQYHYHVPFFYCSPAICSARLTCCCRM